MNEDVSEQALWCMTQDKKWGDDSVAQRDTVTRLLTLYVSRSLALACLLACLEVSRASSSQRLVPLYT